MRVPHRFRGILIGLVSMVAAPALLGMLAPQQLVSAKVSAAIPIAQTLSSLTPGPSPRVLLITPTPSPAFVALITSLGTPTPAAVAAPAFAEPPVGSSKAYALSVLPSFGWGADADAQFSCLNTLWNHESGWNPLDENRYSGAYGIPQALPGSKMAADGSDWQTDPKTQIQWGLHYIKDRYGSPCAAWGVWQANGWY